MYLRKKHLRWAVAAVLPVAAAAIAVAMTAWGLRVRGHARAAAAELESRLRCRAVVTALRPTGPASAVAGAVDLAWTAGGGRLALRMEDIKAESNAYGCHVRAARGILALEGPAPLETLAALNQRLVQPAGAPGLASLVVERLDVRLDVGGRMLRTSIQAVALSNMTAYTVTLVRPETKNAALLGRGEDTLLRKLAVMRLNPASERGVLEYVKADIVSLALGRTAAGEPRADAAIAGALDLEAEYEPADPARPAHLRAALRDLDLEPWTRSMPGGPMTGRAALLLSCDRPAHGPAELELRLDSGGGQISPALLEWLETLPAGLKAGATAGGGPLEFTGLCLRVRVTGNRARFEGPADAGGMAPIMTARVGGVEVPLVRASSRQFDVQEAWPPLAQALGLDGAGPLVD
ncbi:MAG: hypothetical protein FJ288_01875 [Planctomycetes bacterium]|nr:hypothetical protein [Planctomycetota bacterium]